MAIGAPVGPCRPPGPTMTGPPKPPGRSRMSFRVFFCASVRSFASLSSTSFCSASSSLRCLGVSASRPWAWSARTVPGGVGAAHAPGEAGPLRQDGRQGGGELRLFERALGVLVRLREELLHPRDELGLRQLAVLVGVHRLQHRLDHVVGAAAPAATGREAALALALLLHRQPGGVALRGVEPAVAVLVVLLDELADRRAAEEDGAALLVEVLLLVHALRLVDALLLDVLLLDVLFGLLSAHLGQGPQRDADQQQRQQLRNRSPFHHRSFVKEK